MYVLRGNLNLPAFQGSRGSTKGQVTSPTNGFVHKVSEDVLFLVVCQVNLLLLREVLKVGLNFPDALKLCDVIYLTGEVFLPDTTAESHSAEIVSSFVQCSREVSKLCGCCAMTKAAKVADCATSVVTQEDVKCLCLRGCQLSLI